MLVHHRIPSIKQLGVIHLPTGWDASPSQGTQYEVTRSITTSTLDGVLVHHMIPNIKQLGVIHLPPGRDASPSQGTQYEVTGSMTTPTLDRTLVHHCASLVVCCQCTFVFLGAKRQCGVKILVSENGTAHPGQDLPSDLSIAIPICRQLHHVAYACYNE